ncbi:MAG: pyridoxamine 5'-phosphate oxidase family protein [Thermodesulfobacteriota bacterium]
MGKKDKEVRDPAVIAAIIEKSPFCRLALALGNAPYVVPLCFGRAGDTLYFHTGPSGRKLDMLAENSRVCFEMTAEAAVKPGENACSFNIEFASVVGFGTARRVFGEREKMKALDAIMSHYAQGPFVYRPEALAAVVILAVDISEMTGKISGIKDKYIPKA